MDVRHWVGEEDVAFGRSASCAPAPSIAHPGRKEADATATEKSLVRIVYQKTERAGWAVGSSSLRCADSNGAILGAQVANTAQLETSHRSDSGYLLPHLGILRMVHADDGIRATANPRRQPRKTTEHLARKGATSGDRSLYYIINDRVAIAHSAGHVETSRNILNCGTRWPGGPEFPNAREVCPKDTRQT